MAAPRRKPMPALDWHRPARFRSSKASGSFCCGRFGSRELLVHMEADPEVETYCEFDFASVLAPANAAPLADLAAYLVTHGSGRYVQCVVPEAARRAPGFHRAWDDADIALARHHVWLLSRDYEQLRAQPRWGNALLIARSAREPVSPEDTTRIVGHLATVGSLSLSDCMRLCLHSGDGFDAVLKLVSTGTLWLDLDFDLTAGSSIRLSSPNQQGMPASAPPA